MSTSSSKVHVVNLSSYTTPVIKEVQGKDWVEYGEDNDYFQYLIDRYNGSPTNNAILNSLMDLTYGKGLDATDSARKPSEYAAMKGLFTKDCVKKVVSDYVMMGQCAIQVIYSKDHNTIVKVEHIPVETLRAERCDEDGEVKAYYYAKDWFEVAAEPEQQEASKTAEAVKGKLQSRLKAKEPEPVKGAEPIDGITIWFENKTGAFPTEITPGELMGISPGAMPEFKAKNQHILDDVVEICDKIGAHELVGRLTQSDMFPGDAALN